MKIRLWLTRLVTAAAFLLLSGVFILSGNPLDARAAALSSRYKYLEIDGKEIDLNESFGFKGTAGGGTYEIQEKHITFTNYTGGVIMVKCKTGTDMTLIFHGNCTITGCNFGITLDEAPSARIMLEPTAKYPEPTLDIDAKIIGIRAYTGSMATQKLMLQGGGSANSKLHIYIPNKMATYGIEVLGHMEGGKYHSYTEISNLLVDIQAYSPVRGEGFHYQDSSLKEGVAIGTDGALVCRDASLNAYGGSVDHEPWFKYSSDAARYVRQGSIGGKYFSLTPPIENLKLDVRSMNNGRLPADKLFPEIGYKECGRYVFYRLNSLKKNGTTVSKTSKIEPGFKYTAELYFRADAGFQFPAGISAKDIQMPEGFTVTKVERAHASVETYFNSNNLLIVTADVYSEPLQISSAELTSTIEKISAGEKAGASPDLKAESMIGILQLNAKWASSALGTTFNAIFADGGIYYLFCQADTDITALFSDSVAVTFNGEKVPSKYISTVSGGRTLYAAIPYTAHTWPLKKVSQAAECEEVGYKVHYECTGCGKWFTKADGKKEITDKSKYTIPATGHDWGEWEMDPHDGDLHYRYCKHNPAHDEAAPHQFVKTEDTAKRTTTYTCSICGYEKTLAWEDEPAPEVPDDTPIPPEDAPPAGKEDTIITEDIKDKELDIARFHLLQLRYKSITTNSITLVWNKVDGAKAYYVYGSPCGQDYKKLKKIKAGKALQYTQKKLKKGKYYKYLVTAVTSHKKKAVVIAASKTVHLATAGGKVGNYKKLTLTNVTGGKLTLKKGKTFKIQATPVPASKKLKVKQHRKICYESNNTKIATVSKKGTIKAKKKGKCTIYAYAQSGKFVKIKVTVK